MSDASDFEFTGVNGALSKLAGLLEQVSYVELLDYKRQTQLEKIDLTGEALNTFLSTQPQSDEMEVTDDASLLAGIELWLKTMMARQTGLNQRREFYLRGSAPKGAQRLMSQKVVARGIHFEEGAEPSPSSQAAPIVSVPLPQPDMSLAVGEGQRFLAGMGQLQAQQANLGFSQTEHLLTTMQQAHAAMLDSYKHQLDDTRRAAREREDGLLGEIQGLREQINELLRNQQDSHQVNQERLVEIARLQTANNVVNTLSNNFQNYMALKAGAGLPSWAQALMAAITSNPALQAALSDPAVQQLLQNQELLNLLAGQLQMMAHQQKLGSSPAAPPAASGTSEATPA